MSRGFDLTQGFQDLSSWAARTIGGRKAPPAPPPASGAAQQNTLAPTNATSTRSNTQSSSTESVRATSPPPPIPTRPKHGRNFSALPSTFSPPPPPPPPLPEPTVNEHSSSSLTQPSPVHASSLSTSSALDDGAHYQYIVDDHDVDPSLVDAHHPQLASSAPDHILRFKVIKISKKGLYYTRLFLFNTRLPASMTLLNLSANVQSRFEVDDIACVEKCVDEQTTRAAHMHTFHERVIIHFKPVEVKENSFSMAIGAIGIGSSKVKSPLDLMFVDQAARDLVVDLLCTLNSNINIKLVNAFKPKWMPDEEVKSCSACNSNFTLTWRRHHCRYCGGIFCGTCSNQTAALPDLGYAKPVRVCKNCFESIYFMRVQNLAANSGMPEEELINGMSKASPSTHRHVPLRRASAFDPVHSPSSASGDLPPTHLATPTSALTHDTVFSPPSNNKIKRPSFISSAGADKSISNSNALLSPAHLLSPPPSHADSPAQRDMYGFLLSSDQGVRSQHPPSSPPARKASITSTTVSGRSATTHADQLKHAQMLQIHLDKQRQKWNQYLVLNTTIDRDSGELKRLVRKGIPPELRGQMWQILSGSRDKQLSNPPDYYKQMVAESEQNSTTEMHIARQEINKDIGRTFPDNAFFSSESEGLSMLRRVLLAYSVHNPVISYCQSMNFICALLLLFMDEEEAFWMLSTIVEDICCIEVASEDADGNPEASSTQLFYHQSDLAGAHIDQAVFKDLVAEKLPKIHAQLEKLSFPLGPLTVNWFLCLFVNTLPLETTLHMWDCLFSEGIKVLFRASLALLKLNEKAILKANDFEELLNLLKVFSNNALDSSNFLKICFDSMWIGSFPMTRITALRNYHRLRIEHELNDRKVKLKAARKIKDEKKDENDSVTTVVETVSSPLNTLSPPPTRRAASKSGSSHLSTPVQSEKLRASLQLTPNTVQKQINEPASQLDSSQSFSSSMLIPAQFESRWGLFTQLSNSAMNLGTLIIDSYHPNSQQGDGERVDVVEEGDENNEFVVISKQQDKAKVQPPPIPSQHTPTPSPPPLPVPHTTHPPPPPPPPPPASSAHNQPQFVLSVSPPPHPIVPPPLPTSISHPTTTSVDSDPSHVSPSAVPVDARATSPAPPSLHVRPPKSLVRSSLTAASAMAPVQHSEAHHHHNHQQQSANSSQSQPVHQSPEKSTSTAPALISSSSSSLSSSTSSSTPPRHTTSAQASSTSTSPATQSSTATSSPASNSSSSSSPILTSLVSFGRTLQSGVKHLINEIQKEEEAFNLNAQNQTRHKKPPPQQRGMSPSAHSSPQKSVASTSSPLVGSSSSSVAPKSFTPPSSTSIPAINLGATLFDTISSENKNDQMQKKKQEKKETQNIK